MDDTARIWDLRSTNCQGVMRFAGGGNRPAAAFDPHGLVFAVAIGGSQIKLFDVRAYDKGPFATFEPSLGGSKSFACIKFSNSGKLMLLTTTDGSVILLDSFTGALLSVLTGHMNTQGMPLEACFTPDGQFVVAGSEDGGIYRWHTGTGMQSGTVLREHTCPVTAIKCNPTRMMLASACSTLCLWLPS